MKMIVKKNCKKKTQLGKTMSNYLCPSIYLVLKIFTRLYISCAMQILIYGTYVFCRSECPCSFLGADYSPGDVILTSSDIQ